MYNVSNGFLEIAIPKECVLNLFSFKNKMVRQVVMVDKGRSEKYYLQYTAQISFVLIKCFMVGKFLAKRFEEAPKVKLV